MRCSSTKRRDQMSNQKKSVPNLETNVREHLTTLSTTSSKVRYLHSEGYDKGDISRILGIRYQWVRNVLITPLKK